MNSRHRRSIRLRDYDYASAGAYFVTICTWQRELLFEKEVVANVVRKTWDEIPRHFSMAFLDYFVVMPNHVHGIIFIDGSPLGAQHAAPLRRPGVQPGSLGAIVRSFKSAVTKQVSEAHLAETPVWQRNYYDHVIRSEIELSRIREYIQNNPLQWQFDHENADRTPNVYYDREWAWLETPAPQTAGGRTQTR